MRTTARRIGYTLALSGALVAVAPAGASAATQNFPATKQLTATAVHPTSAPRSAAPSAPVSHPLRVADPSQYAAEKAAANRHYQQASAFGPAPQQGAVTPRLSSSIISLNQPGLTAGNFTPPDTTGAIGPNYYVEFVNSQVAVYSRSTLASPPISTMPEDTFTGDSGTCDGQIKWDQQAQRFEFWSLDCIGVAAGAQGFRFGWSKTSDPSDLAAGWCSFRLATGSLLEDYGKLGNYDSFMLVGTNEFNNNGNPTTTVFTQSNVYAIPKPAAGFTTCPATPTVTVMSLGLNYFATPEPANIFGSSNAGLVAARGSTATSLRLYKVTGTATPVLASPTIVTVPAYSLPPDVPQPGTSDPIASSDRRLTQAVAAPDPAIGGALGIWTQHTIAGGAGSVVRWYELQDGVTTPVQTGTISDPSNFVFNGAISPTTSGSSAVVSFNEGSAANKVTIHAQSRTAVDPLGTTSGDVTLATSPGIQADFSCPSNVPMSPPPSSCRWGDYAGASPDPNNAKAVWGTNEFNGANSGTNATWATQNFALLADIPPVAAFTAPPGAVTQGAAVTFDATGSSDPDGSPASYAWTFGDGTNGSGVTTSHTYTAPGTYTVALVVTDDSGSTGTVSHTVTVNAPPPPPPPPPSPVPPSPVLPPSNVFSFSLNGAKLTIVLPGPGVLVVQDANRAGKAQATAKKKKKKKPKSVSKIQKTTLSVARAGPVTVTLKPTASSTKTLKKKSLGVNVRVTFTPTGGTPASKTLTAILKKKK